MTTSLDAIRLEDGTLPAFAWPGGYPMFYVVDDGEALCPRCANLSEAHEAGEPDGWRLEGYDVNYEDHEMPCAHCGELIEAAYEADCLA